MMSVSPRFLLTTVFVYIIGIWYTIVEFVYDRIQPMEYLLTKEIVRVMQSSSFLRRARSYEHIAIVTGGSGTIGSEIVRNLLSEGFRVIILADRVDSSLLLANPNASVITVDLSDLEEVRKVSSGIKEKVCMIDLLVCNAAVMFKRSKVSAQGFEIHMAINLLSHVVLVQNLLNVFHDSKREARIIFVSSSCAHAGTVPVKCRENGTRNLFFECGNVYEAYATSKLALSLYAEQLSRYLMNEDPNDIHAKENKRKKGCNVQICSVHPGCVYGGLYRYVDQPAKFVIDYFVAHFMRRKERAAAIVLATVFQDSLISGGYYENMSAVKLRRDISPTVRRQIFAEIQLLVRNFCPFIDYN